MAERRTPYRMPPGWWIAASALLAIPFWITVVWWVSLWIWGLI